MIERSDHVRVTSGKEEIRARYNGEDYKFPVGVPVDIHHVIAAHVFGFGAEDKSAALARLGWAQSSDQFPAAMQRLQHVKFTTSPGLVEAPPVELTGAPAGDRMPNRTSSGAPIAGGGEAGAVLHPAASAEPRASGKPHSR